MLLIVDTNPATSRIGCTSYAVGFAHIMAGNSGGPMRIGLTEHCQTVAACPANFSDSAKASRNVTLCLEWDGVRAEVLRVD